MSDVFFREVTQNDIPFIAKILSDWQSEEYWNYRVTGYLNRELNPQKALLPRIMYVAIKSGNLVGFIAGHLTERFNCEGELQWINVIPEYRKKGIAFSLLQTLARWFITREARHICVDVGSESGKSFYLKYGAEALNQHWMVWKDISVVLKIRADNT